MARRKQPKAPKGTFPREAEDEYAKRLRRRVRSAHKLVMRELAGPLDVVGPRINERARRDSADDDAIALIRILVTTERAFDLAFGVDEEELKEIARQVDRHSAAKLRKQLSSLPGGALEPDKQRLLAVGLFEDDPRLRALFEDFSRENVALIKSIDRRFFADVAATVRASVEAGETVDTLTKRIAEDFNVSMGRANLIARDQTGTLSGMLDRERHTATGITHFIWSSSDDERVRPEHNLADGNQYSWAEGHPTEGFPGTPIACRCVATPVIPQF